MDQQITVDELVKELQALGLAVHIELAVQRIINRRLVNAQTEHEPEAAG
jgi:hypothetical protein